VRPGSVLAVYLVFASLELGWEMTLTALNMRHVARRASKVPPFLRELWSRRRSDPPEEQYGRSVRYTLARLRLSLAAQAASSAVVIAVVVSGLLGRLDASLASAIPLPSAARVAFVLAVALLLRLASIPFSLYGRFVIEQRFGFNTMGFGLWLLDLLKGLVLSLLLLTPLLLGLFWLMERSGGLWWLCAAAMVTVFQLLLAVLYPAVISPLFNRFSPLQEGTLRSRVIEMASRLAFGVRGIFVMDASKRSRHSNAYFTGLGRSRRIVFYDTLLRRTGEDETLAVLAHEIGHEKLGHVKLELVLSALATVAGLWVLSLLLRWEPFFLAFGLPGPSYHGAIVVFALCSGPFTFVFQPLVSLLERSHEYAADRYARDAMGSSVPMVGALFDLHADNLSNPVPHPLYSFYHYSHPTLAERILALEERDRAGLERVPAVPSPPGVDRPAAST
jgi:STE24 endopeptidase